MIQKRQFSSDIDGTIDALFFGDDADINKACQALQKMGSPAVARLIAVLHGNCETLSETISPARRCQAESAAAAVLGKLGDLHAVPALIEALSHNYSTADLIFTVRPAALEALEQLTGKNFGGDQQAWLTWWKINGGR